MQKICQIFIEDNQIMASHAVWFKSIVDYGFISTGLLLRAFYANIKIKTNCFKSNITGASL